MGFATDPMTYLDHDTAVEHVKAYFADHDGVPCFTGAWFERLDGPTDLPNRITPADLAAVELLSVQIRADAARQLLHGRSDEIEALLRRVELDVDLWEPRARPHLVDGGAADQLWHLFTSIDGIGPVIAGKLCARKRTRLIPVFDQLVGAALGPEDGYWLTLHQWFLDTEGAVDRLQAIKDASSAPNEVPLLRIFDIAVWMAAKMAGSTVEDDCGPDK